MKNPNIPASVESVEPGEEEGIEEAWAAEIEARLARYEAGEGKTISMEEAVQRMRRAAGAR